MFEAEVQIVSDRTHKYVVTRAGRPVRFCDVVAWWQSDSRFRDFFNSLLAASTFSAFRWETPPVTRSTIKRDFEFVLLDSPSLAREPDRNTFARQFAAADADGITVFENLGRDAVLVVPAPGDAGGGYDQLARFVREAPESLWHPLWSCVGQAVTNRLSDRPLWLSTAGGGVAWLHVRLDSRPKYYGYSPYATDQE